MKFIMAKTKMAPKKIILGTKLELQAALLGAGLWNYVEKAFTPDFKIRFDEPINGLGLTQT